VANTLGCGFLEKVYENALATELRMAGLAVKQQHGITVTYKGVAVGEYLVDLLIEDAVLIELKTVRTRDRAHRAQCINYLRATGRHLCLLLNFGAPRRRCNASFWARESCTAIPNRPALFAFIRGHLRAFALPSCFSPRGESSKYLSWSGDFDFGVSVCWIHSLAAADGRSDAGIASQSRPFCEPLYGHLPGRLFDVTASGDPGLR
jgi:GxxExxY protein